MDTEVGEEALRPEDAGNDGGAYIHQTAVRQPPGECDPVPSSCPRRSFAEPPDQLPMPANKSNIHALENWIRTHFKESAFNQCKRQPWPTPTGVPMKIHTKPETKPYCCKKPTMVPLNIRAQVKTDIEADVMKGILKRVPDGNPTHGALD